MSIYRLFFLVVVLCIFSCNCSSETHETEPRTVPVKQTEPPQSSQHGPSEDVSEKKDENEAKDGKAQQEKLVVAYVPEYPSKITQPWMLANTSHFIMFYASWCSYSEAAMPYFKDTLQYIVDQNITGIHLGKIEITKNGEVIKNFKIRSTPTFIMYYRNARYVYDDEVNTESFIAFIHNVLAINLTKVTSSRQLSEVQSHHPVIFLLVHDGEMDPDWHQTYATVAQEKGLWAKFYFTTKIDLVQAYNVTKFPTLMVLKDGRSYRFSDSLSTYNIGKWVSRERHPTLPTVDEDTFRPFTNFVLGRKLAILLIHEDPNEQRITEKRLIDTVRRVAESRKVFLHFQFVLLTSLSLAERMIQSQIPELPYLFVYDHSTGYYYPFQPPEDGKGITESAIKEFCNAVRHRKLEPLGGNRVSYLDIFASWWLKLYVTYQAMVTYRPWLSLSAGFSVCGVILFYSTTCCFRNSKQQQADASKRARRGKRLRNSAAAAREKAKRQVERNRQDTESSQHNGGVVRRRMKTELEGEGDDFSSGEENFEQESQPESQESSEDNHSHRKKS